MNDSRLVKMTIQDSSEQRETNTNKNYIDMNNTNPMLKRLRFVAQSCDLGKPKFLWNKSQKRQRQSDLPRKVCLLQFLLMCIGRLHRMRMRMWVFSPHIRVKNWQRPLFIQ